VLTRLTVPAFAIAAAIAYGDIVAIKSCPCPHVLKRVKRFIPALKNNNI
jgi:hypothetical protein